MQLCKLCTNPTKIKASLPRFSDAFALEIELDHLDGVPIEGVVLETDALAPSLRYSANKFLHLLKSKIIKHIKTLLKYTSEYFIFILNAKNNYILVQQIQPS